MIETIIKQHQSPLFFPSHLPLNFSNKFTNFQLHPSSSCLLFNNESNHNFLSLVQISRNQSIRSTRSESRIRRFGAVFEPVMAE
ncbi:hypothetical protein QVD17_01331 [Tagetes erecta]|uniref:Uncharacterized protein n=1 Tax=Tagetes erecta TaxID=13708 RepID=A0AAD8LDA5_TARER|nr:hypothetical protein QVD17_01331 [Tagetes erecta]